MIEATTMALGERGMDALRELFNIGAGNAATSLSQMLKGERVSVELPEISVQTVQELGTALGNAKRVVCGVGFTISGGMNAHLMLVFDESSAARLASVLLGRPSPRGGARFELDGPARSALEETGNILASSFVSGLGRLTNRRIMPSVPSSGLDMAGALVDTLLGTLGMQANESIVCRTDLATRGTRINGHLILMPDRRSLAEVLAALGIDPAS